MKLAAGLRLSLFCALIALAACQRDHGASAGGVLPDFADLVEHVSPSVVNISTVPADAPATSPTSADPGVDGSDADSLKDTPRSEEHTSELQSLMRNSYAVFCLKTKTI